MDGTVLSLRALRRETTLVQDSGDCQSRALLEVEVEDLADEDGFGLVYDEPLVLDRVAEGDRAARPLPLPPRRCDLVAVLSPIISLSNSAKDMSMLRVSRPIGVGGREVLGDGHEGCSGPTEALHQLGEVEERAAQAVDLVDDYDVDLSRVDVGQEPLEGRPLDVCPGEAAVVVAVVDEGSSPAAS